MEENMHQDAGHAEKDQKLSNSDTKAGKKTFVKAVRDDFLNDRQLGSMRYHRIHKKIQKKDNRGIKIMRILGLLPFTHV